MNTAWPREPYPNVESMLEPPELSRLLGRRVSSVVLEPFSEVFTSTEAGFQGLRLDDEREPSLVLKSVDPAKDWVAITTDDRRDRAVAIWAAGVLDRFPNEVDPTVVACSRDDTGYTILMPNIRAQLLPEATAWSAEVRHATLEGLASMHAAFWQDPVLDDDRVGWCSVEAFIGHLSPSAHAQARKRVDSFVFGVATEGWEVLSGLIDRGLARDLLTIADDPSGLVAALQPFPRTLTHTDFRPANLGYRAGANGETAVLLVDWGRPAAAPPMLDMGYFLTWSERELEGTFDDAIAHYEAALPERMGDAVAEPWWRRQRELGLLAGFVGSACFLALRASPDHDDVAVSRQALDWWARRASGALALL